MRGHAPVPLWQRGNMRAWDALQKRATAGRQRECLQQLLPPGRLPAAALAAVCVLLLVRAMPL